MRREALAAVSAVVVAGCGADSASSTTSSTTTAPTGATAAYCQAFRSYAALSAQLGPDLSVNPDLATIKALIARLATQIDLADADAPAATSADMRTVRTAFDTMNASVQGATTLQAVATAVTGASGQSLVAATDRVAQTTTRICGFPSPSASPS